MWWNPNARLATGKGQLNVSQGGRSLKRVFPHKVKSTAATKLPNQFPDRISKQGQGNGNMACCQAATIGLAALSTMGLPSSLLSGGADNRAVAAEPPAIDFSKKVASDQLDVVSGVTTSKGLLLQKLTREYVEEASVAENPNTTLLLVGQEEENPSFHKLELEPKVKTVTRATMPYQQQALLEMGPSKPSELKTKVGQLEGREGTEAIGFQKQLKTQTDATIFPKQPSDQKELTITSVAMPAGFVEVELERDRINTSTEVAYESPMTAKAEGAVVIDSDRIEAPVSTLYEIQPGDTLGVIASRHGVSVEELVELNNLGDPDWLQVNDTLKIPQKRSQTYGQILKDSAGAYDSTKANSQPKTLSLNESTDYGFTLPTPETQRTSIEGFQSVSFPKQGSPYLAQKIELKEKFRDGLAPLMLRVDPATTAGQFLSGAVEAPEVEGFGQSSPINLRPTSTENLEREDASESSQQNPGNDSYSQRLRAEIRRLRQEYEFEQDSEAIANNWDSQPSANDTESEGLEPSLNHSPTTTEFDSNDPIQWRRPEISSPNNREVLERMSPRRQEIYPLQPFSSPKQRQAEESTLVGSTSFKAQEILNSSLGEMVSPDLPPLEGADTYLPGGSMEFTGYIWPAKGTLTSGYGWRWGRMHRGIDIAAPTGTPIMAAAPGVVSFAGWNSGYGYLVEIKHPDESLTLYAHNSQILVQEGQAVAQGELIAKMGSTGRSTGPHLHFEIHPTGDGASNPIAYLPSVRASR